MSFEPSINGPCYVQIPAHSLQRAMKFYQNVIDANISNPEAAASNKDKETLHMSFEGPVNTSIYGGIIKLPGTDESETLQGGRKFGWSNLYFYVKDMEATLQKVKDSAGHVLMDRTLIGGQSNGWHAEFRDTEGNFFGLYTDIPPKT